MMNEALVLGESNLAWAASAPSDATPRTEASEYDHLLARRVADGDMWAFEELYTRYHRRIYALCLRMTGNVAEAEDLTQEIFIHVSRKVGSFRGDSTLRTWLHRVAVNKTLMHFRKNSVRRERTTSDGTTPEPASLSAQTQSYIPTLDRLSLDAAIAQLAPGYRAVFILHDVEGYEHSEVARICGISVGTSKSQLHKARMKLRQLIAPPVA